MSRSTLAALSARRTAALFTTATTALGLLALAGPAHADSVVQIAGPAGPVPANTAYTVTIDVPNTNPKPSSRAVMVNVTLSGAAATVTSAHASAQDWACDFAAGTTGMCWNLASLPTPTSLTLTVLPTAGGTVAAVADARNGGDQQTGTATLDTQVTAPAPVVTGLAPDHGPQAGGTTVTLTGTHLTGTTAVGFGPVPASKFTVDSDTRITATAPAASAPGKVDVTVTTPGGTAAAGQYTYQDPAATGSYVFSTTSDPKPGSTVATGAKVTYRVTVAQKGADEVKGATVTADLSKVLDDAGYSGDVKATAGTAEVKDGKLAWTGDLPVGGSATITYSVTVNGNGDRQLHSIVSTLDGKRGACDTDKGCTTDHTVPAVSTPSPTPTPTPTPTAGGQTPGTPGPSASASSSATAAPGPSTDTQAPAAPAPPQASGALADTGSTVLTSASIGGALLLLGGLTVALSRRRRHGQG